MSISTISSSISRLQKEIADLHHKISLETKKENDCSNRIGQINRSITKSTPVSTLKSKAAEVDRKNGEIVKIQVKKAVWIIYHFQGGRPRPNSLQPENTLGECSNILNF